MIKIKSICGEFIITPKKGLIKIYPSRYLEHTFQFSPQYDHETLTKTDDYNELMLQRNLCHTVEVENKWSLSELCTN